MNHKKTFLLCIVLLPLVLFGCATTLMTATAKEYQADLIVGKTSKADIARMLGAPVADSGNSWLYHFNSIVYGKRAKIRVVQADGTEILYELGKGSHTGSVTVSINPQTHILESVSIVDI